MTATPVIARYALFSADRKKRYSLSRYWHSEGEAPRILNIIGLNPSDADEEKDDMTARKGIGFARRWGYNGVVFTNLRADVSTDPWGLTPWNGIDQANREVQRLWAVNAALVLAAWGTMPRDLARRICLPELIYEARNNAGRALHCIGETQDGSPMHPSRCAYTDAPRLWREML